MEILRIFIHVLTIILTYALFGIPALAFGICELKNGEYPKSFCIYSIITGIVLCVAGPIIYFIVYS